jgi:hypothetical protein
MIAWGKTEHSEAAARGNTHPTPPSFFQFGLRGARKTNPKKEKYIYFIRVTPGGAPLTRG